MKQFLSMATMALLAVSSVAQAQKTDNRFYLGVNLKAGGVNERLLMKSIGLNYDSPLNFRMGDKDGNVTIDNDMSYGAEVKVGYYFGKHKRWGIGTGVVYTTFSGSKTTGGLHVEYRATDFKKEVYRQIISSDGPLKEDYTVTNMAIPLTLNYKTKFKGNLGFQADVGLLYNVGMKTEYTSKASFDYEAIYRYQNINGTETAVYDNNPVPAEDSWLITVEQYRKNRTDGGEAAYFETLRAQGYSVGLDREAARKSGNTSYKGGSLGFIIQPSLVWKVGDNMLLNLGGYVMYQPYKNGEDNKNLKVVDESGNYNPVWQNAIGADFTSYGINVGATFFLF